MGTLFFSLNNIETKKWKTLKKMKLIGIVYLKYLGEK